MIGITPAPLDLQGALNARLQHNHRLGDRATSIGASEIGACPRKTIASKRTPTDLDSTSAGRMAAGRAMENEIVQLVRLALGSRLRDTGRVQKEYRHSSLPFVAHPDGRILAENGDGILEVKTASASTFKHYTQEGLPQRYLDQVQAQMGLSGLTWGLVVLVSRENLAEAASFEVLFNPDHYRYLEARARVAAEHLASGETLPEGEPDSFCFNCPFRHDCNQFQDLRRAGEQGELAEPVRLQLEAQLEELAHTEAELNPLEARATELRSQIKDTLQTYAVCKVILEHGIVQMVTSSRSSFDSKALASVSPEIYSRFLKSTTFTNLRITTSKRSNPCLQTV